MPPEGKAEYLARLRTKRLLEELARDPALIMARAEMAPDHWQARVLRSHSDRLLLLCSRQSGKSQTAAALALREALLSPPALVLLLSPTLRQSGELFREKVLPLWRALGCPCRKGDPTQLELRLSNGSRVVSLPENEAGIRGFSAVSVLVIDEAARVDDSLYYSVRAMLATTRGRLVALSTPFGRRGWFFKEWTGPDRWDRVRIRAHECPRIPADFLAEEGRALGPRWYAQEYECSFEDVVGGVFSGDSLASLLTPSVAAVPFPES